MTFDLTGLPPSPEEMEAFLADQAPEARRRAVERLLASSHFGEHWARLWLDIARYAEDQAHIVGNDTSLCYPNAWIYRDWVIQAFNDDVPYDRFLRLQLAADLLDRWHDVLPQFVKVMPTDYKRVLEEQKAATLRPTIAVA